MPDESQMVRGIDWKTSFPFTLIFRTFRVAIHPSKLVLALLALLLIYGGGRVLDGLWPSRALAVPNEVTIYENAHNAWTIPFWTSRDRSSFEESRDGVRLRLQNNYEAELLHIKGVDGNLGRNLGDIKDYLLAQRQKRVEAALSASKISKATSDEDRHGMEKTRDREILAAYAEASQEYQGYSAVRGIGLFHTFIDYELDLGHRMIASALSGDLFGPAGAISSLIGIATTAPAWGITAHTVYFVIFGIYFLFIWAIFGGAIARIAAVQVARDEKISVRQALSFSTAKFLSFLSAPIIPLLIIAVIGMVVAVGGLIFNVPIVQIIAAALFFMALAAGFVMTLVLLGLIGGFNLMYPTIAVEGSDSFDAISRSFSYVYARPWRLLFYSLVATVYGVLCYAFVRFFVRIMLGMTHVFVGLFIFRHADNTLPLWSMLWPDPLAGPRLSYDIDFLTLSTGQDISAILLALWVYLTIAMLGAFAASFYFSANTIIYILMRREVDATELDDVYLEQVDEEFTENAPSGTVPTIPATDTPPATEPPSV